jgi:hypothetical protein
MVALLYDPVPGNIGLELDDDTVVLLPLTESAGVRPRDAAGTLEDLALLGAALPAPDATVSWASAASWLFGADSAIGAVDRADKSSLLTRDVSVQASLAFVDGTYTGALITRGVGGSAAEYSAFAVELDCSGLPDLRVRMSWQDTGGTLRADAWQTVPAQFVPTESSGEMMLLTVTRRWESSTSVVMRYYCGDTLIAETTSTFGAIGGGTTGTTAIGDAVQIWLDDLKVVSREMSHEEIRATWARLTRHQPAGAAMVRGQGPPGAPFAEQTAGDIGKLVKAAGQAVGYATAKADELHQTFLPDRAYREDLARWEQLVGLEQNSRAALDTRRARVVARLQRVNGYSPPKVKDVLSTPFDLDAADVQLIEFSPTIEDAFPVTTPGAPPNTLRWRADPVAAWTLQTGSVLQLQAASGDLRFQPGAFNPHHCRMSVDDETDMIVQGKLATYWAALPSSAIVGLFLYNRVTNDALWFGVKNDGGTRKLGYVQLKDNVLGTFQVLVNPSTDAAYWLRITRLSGLGPGCYRLYWSLTGFSAGTTTTILDTGILNPQWCGFGAMATTNPTGSTLTATFDDFLARFPQSRRAFRWFAYRNPGLPGDPDMLDARRIVQTLKPAHTEATAINSLSVLCDNTNSGCDAGPLGGI